MKCQDEPGSLQAIILAAGKGTRMGGQMPKVLYPVADQPMLWWVVRACQEAGVQRCVIVVGYQGDRVRAAMEGVDGCVFVEQREQKGTGHAVQMAEPVFDTAEPGDIYVLAGDGPLIRPRTLTQLLQTHRRGCADATLATAVLDNPHGYGRVIRDAEGAFQAIVEQADATDQQRQVREVNPSYYCFRGDRLFEALAGISDANAQQEYYLTDVMSVLRGAGRPICVVNSVPPQDVFGVNNPQDLERVDQLMRARLGAEPTQPSGASS